MTASKADWFSVKTKTKTKTYVVPPQPKKDVQKERAVQARRSVPEESLHLLPEAIRLQIFRNRISVSMPEVSAEPDDEWLRTNARGFYVFFDCDEGDEIGFELEEDMVAFTLYLAA